jgi:beta-glucosidase/6-phospho-beta-glucosidase/beta-galactosidase
MLQISALLYQTTTMNMPVLLFFIVFAQFFVQFKLLAAEFTPDFVFGVANAPGQVEDQLDDIWKDWGEQGHISGWKNTAHPAERLQFWTHPETELDLAQKLGVQSFRMGVDWGRVMPARAEFDEKAIDHYREILRMAKKRHLKILLSLWHHSVPKWVQQSGGWHNEENKKDFVRFAERIITEFEPEVSWWVTFNEANIFVNNAYTVGMWPPGEKPSPLAFLEFGPWKGSSLRALDRMAEAHNEIYTWAHVRFPDIRMGIAHNMAHYRALHFYDALTAYLADRIMNWHLPEKIKNHMDFFGINYYGAEWLSWDRISLAAEAEYSESGRAIDAQGLLELMKKSYALYKLPIIITENGVADRLDGIRAAYLIEHLMAVHSALEQKIPVEGYYVWSLTDNLEWSDGYCPQFGLVSVERESFKRRPRPSFAVYHEIASQKKISPELRHSAWQQVLNLQGTDRPFCRGEDGVTAFDRPKPRPYSHIDWSFKAPGL